MAAEIDRREIEVRIVGTDVLVPKQLFEHGLLITSRQEGQQTSHEGSKEWYPLGELRAVTKLGREQIASIVMPRKDLNAVVTIYWHSYWRSYKKPRNGISVNEAGTPIDPDGKNFHDPDFAGKTLQGMVQAAIIWFRRRAIRFIAQSEGWESVGEGENDD